MSQLDLNLGDDPLASSAADSGSMGSMDAEGSLEADSMDSPSMAPARGVIVKKPPTSIYTVLMIIATLAMLMGCIFLSLEVARYGG